MDFVLRGQKMPRPSCIPWNLRASEKRRGEEMCVCECAHLCACVCQRACVCMCVCVCVRQLDCGDPGFHELVCFLWPCFRTLLEINLVICNMWTSDVCGCLCVDET